MSLSFSYIGNVHPYLRSEMSCFAKWLKKHYEFPISLDIRLMHQDVLIDSDKPGCTLRWRHNSGDFESVEGEIAVKSFNQNLENEGEHVAFPTVVVAINSLVGHYFQTINDSPSREDDLINWSNKVLDALIANTNPPSPREILYGVVGSR